MCRQLALAMSVEVRGRKAAGEAFISDQRSSDVRLIRGEHWSDVERRVAPGRCLRQVPLLLSE
jgi:hypothetical protein